MFRLIPIFFFLLFILNGCGDFEDSNERPNILFIMSDDHAYQAISAYDDRLIQTPNIDRIAVSYTHLTLPTICSV